MGTKLLFRSREQRRVLGRLGELRKFSPKGIASAGSAPYQMSSSRFSGMQGVMAAIAHSICEASGSFVVMR